MATQMSLAEIRVNRQRIYASYLRHHGFLVMEYPIQIRWKVNKHRRDKRTGATSCVPMGDYAKKQYQDAMRRWFS
jgi:hypothetical protein